MKIHLVYLVMNSPQDTAYSYGLGYVAAALRQAGQTVTMSAVRDGADVDALLDRLGADRPGILGLSATTSQFGYARSLASRLKETCEAFVVCGGAHPTLMPECLVDAPALDAIVRGEGEQPMVELADALEAGRDSSAIHNLWLRQGDRIIENPMRPFLPDLDALPMPDKTSLDYQAVIDAAGGVNRFIFSRGCTYGCTYCSNRALSRLADGRYFRQQSVDRALAEIRHDLDRFRFERIVFDDDAITLRPDWFHAFFERYREAIGLPFTCNVRVGTVDREMLTLLREAGCTTVVMGIEHGNEQFRTQVLKRRMSNRDIIETFDTCHALGMRTFGQVIVGFPNETKRLFLDTVRLCRRVGVRNPVSIFQPYPATELGEICEVNGWLPGRSAFRERREAVIDFPEFGRREIQQCADAFPILTQARWLPLWLPIGWSVALWRRMDLMHYLVRRTVKHVAAGLRRTLAGAAQLLTPFRSISSQR